MRGSGTGEGRENARGEISAGDGADGEEVRGKGKKVDGRCRGGGERKEPARTLLGGVRSDSE